MLQGRQFLQNRNDPLKPALHLQLIGLKTGVVLKVSEGMGAENTTLRRSSGAKTSLG